MPDERLQVKGRRKVEAALEKVPAQEKESCSPLGRSGAACHTVVEAMRRRAYSICFATAIDPGPSGRLPADFSSHRGFR